MRTKKLSKLVKNILIIKSFNKIVVCCKMFHKELMKAFKETELHEEDEITLFLCLLMQGFKNHIKLSHFFYKKNLSFSFIFYYSEKFCVLCNRFLSKIYYSTSSEYFQMISCFLSILMRFAKFHKFDNAFNDFNSESASCDIVC